MEEHRVAPAWVFVKFRTSGEGPRDHETLHHVEVLELVSNGVRMVGAGLPRESPKVICGQPHLTLIAMCSSYNAPRVGAAHLPAIVVVVVGRGRGPMRMLLMPLLAALSAILGAMDDNIGRHLVAAACGRLLASLGGTKCDRLIVGGIRVGDATWLLGGVPKNVDAFVRAQLSHVVHRSCTRAFLVSLRFDALALQPQWGLG
jgi:hypothetical protein